MSGGAIQRVCFFILCKNRCVPWPENVDVITLNQISCTVTGGPPASGTVARSYSNLVKLHSLLFIVQSC